MKCTLLPFATLMAFAFGCNTAQITTPPLVDAGPPCPSRAPTITCDAGALPTPGACSGSVPVLPIVGEGTDASTTVPAGSYELGCTVSFWVQDVASPDCLPTQPCTCVSPDSGAPLDEDGGATDGAAPPVSPGVWTCLPIQ
jgi:hypothetical protein